MASTLDSLRRAQINDSSGEPRGDVNDAWLQKVVLGFDGGGVRGYWSLLILRKLMQEIQEVELAEDPTTGSSFSPCEEPQNISHLPGNSFTHFLPCHYFDYVGGTSTGALITILLSRFRMTVDDCLQEYRTMAGSIFRYPRLVHRMNLYIVPWNKYSRARLEKTVRNVITRRVEDGHPSYSEVIFQTEMNACRGIVLALQTGLNRATEKRFLFRSYTPYSERDHGRHPGGMRNSDIGTKVPVVRAALAGTAAPLYFGHYQMPISARQLRNIQRHPTDVQPSRAGTFGSFINRTPDGAHFPGETTMEFMDAGFGDTNNPCEELLKEIEHLHVTGAANNPIIVSIGTARSRTTKPRRSNHGEGFSRTVRRLFDNIGDPELNHERLRGFRDDGRCIYHRFNQPEGLPLEMDAWEPRRDGQKTLDEMETVFNNWLQGPEALDGIRTCARELVGLRRARASQNRPQWERFALCQYFECSLSNCIQDRDKQWLDRVEFENHLRRNHRVNDQDLSAEVESCRYKWEYRPRPQADGSA